MFFAPENSLCEKHQSIVVSQDNGSARKHIANNPKKIFDLRHYKLDGGVFKQTKCCDFLLLNDTQKKAYLIELKGGNIDDAVEQLEEGERKVKNELKGYTFFYRIVCSKAKTHKINGTTYRKFKEKCGSRLVLKVALLEETLD